VAIGSVLELRTVRLVRWRRGGRLHDFDQEHLGLVHSRLVVHGKRSAAQITRSELRVPYGEGSTAGHPDHEWDEGLGRQHAS